MIQFYFLSIFFNVLAGYVLITGEEGKPFEIHPGFSFKDESSRLVLGILTMATGILKLLSSVEGDMPVLGDIIPAVIGFGAGFVLVFEYYRSHAGLDDEKGESIGHVLVRNRKIIGFLAVAAAALHFLFPKVLLL
jgi:uncharacterized membrane-anchored protein